MLKIIVLIIMSAISLFDLLLALGYTRKAKRYRKAKAAIENEETDEAGDDAIWQRTCPKCGKTHDIDYPKCPDCGYNYLEHRN